MSTITIEVPRELAERLSPYREKLPQILELGLAHLESVSPRSDDIRERTLRVLKATGLVRMPNPSPLPRRRHTPINVPGKPLSELIIEQRGKL